MYSIAASFPTVLSLPLLVFTGRQGIRESSGTWAPYPQSSQPRICSLQVGETPFSTPVAPLSDPRGLLLHRQDMDLDPLWTLTPVLAGLSLQPKQPPTQSHRRGAVAAARPT